MNNQDNANAHFKPGKRKGNTIHSGKATLEKDIPVARTNDSTESATISKQILLTIVAVAMFLLIRNFFGKAVFEKAKAYKQEFRSGLGSIGRDSLMGSRFGIDYLLPRHFVKIMAPKTPILLMPPVQYTKKFITQQPVHSLTNPIYLFYMNHGIKTVNMESRDIAKANCTVLIDKEGRCYPIRITNKDQLKFAMMLFSKGEPYKPTIQ